MAAETQPKEGGGVRVRGRDTGNKDRGGVREGKTWDEGKGTG